MDIDTEDGWRHLVQELRGKDSHKNQETVRLLQNAIEALQADPPFIKAALEKIEDVINLHK